MKRLLVVGVLLAIAALSFADGSLEFDHVLTIPAENDGRGMLAEFDFAGQQDIMGGPLYAVVDLVAAVKGGEDKALQSSDLELGVGLVAGDLGTIECYLETVTNHVADTVDPVVSIKITWVKTFSW